MADKHAPVKWSSMPRKDQLFVLCLVRISEPIVRFSIISYIYYQLQSLDPSLPSGELIKQASYLRTTYTIAQCTSSVLWGRVADSPRGGRKAVMLVSLTGTFLSMSLLGFISSFKQAVFLHAIQGITNSNVAIVRTMVSEVVQEKRFQASAFMLLPVCTSIATIIGPLIAGSTAEIGTRMQGDSDSDKNAFLRRYPYALPALLNAGVLLLSLLATFFFLEETLEPLRGGYDPGIAISRRLGSLLCLSSSKGQTVHYKAIAPDAEGEQEMEFMRDIDGSDESSSSGHPITPVEADSQAEKKPAPVLPTHRIFTTHMLLVLLALVIQDLHLSVTSDAMFNLFSSPVSSREEELSRVLPLRFGGGAGFKPHSLAWAPVIFGITGLPIQVFVYPRVTQRLGNIKTWRLFVLAFPLLYFLYPYIAVMPSSTPPPAEKTGAAVWAYIVLIASITGLIASPVAACQLIFTNFSSPHPSALGRTHSITFFVSTAVRAAGSALSGTLLAYGSTHNLTGLPFWFSSLVSVAGIALSPFVKEGNGHEIWLPGDEID